MNIDNHNKKTNYKTEFMAVFVLSIFILVSCVSQLNIPWTCKKGKEAWQEQPINQSNQLSQQTKQIIVNRDTIHLCF